MEQCKPLTRGLPKNAVSAKHFMRAAAAQGGTVQVEPMKPVSKLYEKQALETKI